MNSPSSVPRNFRGRKQYQIAKPRGRTPGQLVAVIADRASLEKAKHLRALPDFFELRLDALRDFHEEVETVIPQLRAPLILTARHPAEGGGGSLSTTARRQLITHFLDHASCVDLELRSRALLRSLGEKIRAHKISLILSSHELRETPSPNELNNRLDAAIAAGAQLFKVATRTDNRPQLDRLLEFYQENASRFPIAAMGIGRLGRESRRIFFRLGSALNYASLGRPNVQGQPSLEQLRRFR